MRLELSNDYFMSPPTEADIPAFIKHLNDPYIFARTLMLPADYAEKDARFFLTLCKSHEDTFGHPLHFSVRNPEGETIGGCGFHGKNTVAGLAHRDEIGYWMATAYRGRGIMTQAVKAIAEYGFNTRKLLRIVAPVYAFNKESAAVLLKNGFVCEGIAKKAYFRSAEYHDALLYALVRS